MAKDKAPRNGETTDESVEHAGASGGDAFARRSDGPQMGTNEVDLEGTRGVVDERLERRSAKNEEGHAKNMEAEEKLHKDNDQKPDPKLGREDNGNTPVIGKDGTKTWGPPGVAGAER